MNSRWLWNSHRRHKFLKAKASRDILKYRVSEIAFPGFSSSIFHHGRQAVSQAFHVVVVQWRQRNEQKKRDARAKLLFYSKPVFFLPFSSLSPSSQSATQPFFVSSRNAPPPQGGALRDDTKNGCVADYRRRCPSYLFHRCAASVAMFSFYFSLSPLSYLGDLMSGIPEVHQRQQIFDPLLKER